VPTGTWTVPTTVYSTALPLCTQYTVAILYLFADGELFCSLLMSKIAPRASDTGTDAITWSVVVAVVVMVDDLIFVLIVVL